MRQRGAPPHGNPSVICRAIHAAVGCAVTLIQTRPPPPMICSSFRPLATVDWVMSIPTYGPPRRQPISVIRFKQSASRILPVGLARPRSYSAACRLRRIDEGAGGSAADGCDAGMRDVMSCAQSRGICDRNGRSCAGLGNSVPDRENGDFDTWAAGGATSTERHLGLLSSFSSTCSRRRSDDCVG
jgi:hypothetical protein